MRWPLLLGVTLLAGSLAAPAAWADWLVLHDGSRIETVGPWKTKGRQVIFTRSGGGLSTLRLADVDLEASASATEEEPEAPPAADPPTPRRERRQSVLVLTDDDIGPATEGTEDDDGDAEDESGDEEVAEATSEEAAAESVTLVSWTSQESTDIDGLEIVGVVRNTGPDVAAAIRVGLQVRDEDDLLLRETQAFLQAGSLAPGQRTTFKALLPGIYTLLIDPTFEVASETITIQGPRRSGDAEDDLQALEEDLTSAEPDG